MRRILSAVLASAILIQASPAFSLPGESFAPGATATTTSGGFESINDLRNQIAYKRTQLSEAYGEKNDAQNASMRNSADEEIELRRAELAVLNAKLHLAQVMSRK
ncbi:MAG: hypothetical protein V4692_08780 [Bdellovibrionota bacterium]